MNNIDAMPLMQVAIAIFDVVALFFFIKRKNKYELLIKPSFWLVGSWLVCLSLYLFSGISYTFNLSLTGVGFICLFWALFFLGGKLVACFVKRKRKKNKHDIEKIIVEAKSESRLDLFPIFVVAMLALVVYVFHVTTNNVIVFGETRDMNVDGFDTLMLIFASSSLVIWLYELIIAIATEKSVSWYGIVSAIAYNVPGLIISGRDALILFILSSFIVVFFCGRSFESCKRRKNTSYTRVKRLFLLTMAIVMIYIIFLSNNRYGEGENMIQLFETRGYCVFPEYLVWVYNHLGGFGKVIINAIFYYSSQFSKLSVIFSGYTGPYLYGFANMHYISRLLPESWGLNYNVNVLNSLQDLLVSADASGLRGFWGTMFEHLIYDFSRAGTLLVGFVVGALYHVYYYLFRGKSAILSLLFDVFACLAAYMTVTFSPIVDYFFIFPLAWLIIIYVVHMRKINKGRALGEKMVRES